MKVTNGEIMGGGTHETTIGMKFWEHDCLNRPDSSKRIVPSGNFYAADISDWNRSMGYHFMGTNAIGALPHRATLVKRTRTVLLGYPLTMPEAYLSAPEMRRKQS